MPSSARRAGGDQQHPAGAWVRALDFQAIVDVVGDKLREVFATGDMGICWWDEETRLNSHLYGYEHGVRLHIPPRVVEPDSVVARFYRERKVRLVNSQAEQAALGLTTIPGTDQARSIVTVPMMAGERIFGALQLEDHERDNAFGPAEVRLLETITASMAVALLNAKSYEAERQRAAELAIVNSVQAGLASKLDMQAIYDLVGDKIREIFSAQGVGIGVYDPATGLVTIPYLIERGRRIDAGDRGRPPSGALPPTFAARADIDHQYRHGRAHGRVWRSHPTRRDAEVGPLGSAARGRAVARGHNGAGPGPRKRVHRSRRPTARNPGRQHERGAGERPPLRRDAAAVDGDRATRNAELAIINSMQQGMAAELNIQGIFDPVGDKMRAIFRHGRRWHPARSRSADGPDPIPLLLQATGERLTVPSARPCNGRRVSRRMCFARARR